MQGRCDMDFVASRIRVIILRHVVVYLGNVAQRLPYAAVTDLRSGFPWAPAAAGRLAAGPVLSRVVPPAAPSQEAPAGAGVDDCPAAGLPEMVGPADAGTARTRPNHRRDAGHVCDPAAGRDLASHGGCLWPLPQAVRGIDLSHGFGGRAGAQCSGKGWARAVAGRDFDRNPHAAVGIPVPFPSRGLGDRGSQGDLCGDLPLATHAHSQGTRHDSQAFTGRYWALVLFRASGNDLYAFALVDAVGVPAERMVFADPGFDQDAEARSDSGPSPVAGDPRGVPWPAPAPGDSIEHQLPYALWLASTVVPCGGHPAQQTARASRMATLSCARDGSRGLSGCDDASAAVDGPQLGCDHERLLFLGEESGHPKSTAAVLIAAVLIPWALLAAALILCWRAVG